VSTEQRTFHDGARMRPPPAWLAGFFLILITLALYWPVRHFEFNNYDDRQYITENPNVQNGLTLPAVKWAFTAVGYAWNWHPLTWLSHLLDVQLFGFNAGAHHFTNVLFHTANTLLLFLLLRRWTGDLWRSVFVAALFGWHPLHVESVAWVAERKDVLSTFFFFLTLLAYTRYASELKIKNSNYKLYYGLALVCFALGLMSKPMLVTLPIVMLLLDYWPLCRIYGSKKDTADSECAGILAGAMSLDRAVAEKVPFFALAAVSCAITYVAQRTAVEDLSSFSLVDRISNALVSYAKYLGKVFWPMNLAIPYPYVHHLPPMEVAGAAVLLLAVSALSLRFARSHPPLFVGWFWFLITLVPVIGLVQVGGEPMADRYMYIPSVGIFVILAWEAPLLFKASSDDSLALPAAAFVLICCWVLASAQISYWRNSMTLWTHTLRVTKDNAVAESNMASELDSEGRFDEAVRYARDALRILPNYAEAQNNLGCLLSKRGDIAEGVPYLEAAVKSAPRHLQYYLNLALAYRKLDRLDEAAAEYRSATKLDPQNVTAYVCLGDVLVQQGHTADAVPQYQAASRLLPGDKGIQSRLARFQNNAP
jgi:protein O-mannosyl-transferase